MTQAVWCTLPEAGAFRYPECNGAADPVTVASAADLITVASAAQIETTRTALRQYLWGAGGLPSAAPNVVETNIVDAAYDSLPHVDQIDRYTTTYATLGTTMRVYHFRNDAPNGRVLAWYMGHAGNGIKYPHSMWSMARALNAGYDVLGCALPFYGDYQGSGLYNGNVLDNHQVDLWIPQADIEALGYSPCILFVDPLVRALNQVAADYSMVGAFGYSGGGWAIELIAAVDPRVTRSYPVAASIPWFARDPLNSDELGHYETYVAGLYEIATYEDWYVMGVSDGRRQLKILGEQDTIYASETIPLFRSAISARVTSIAGCGQWECVGDPTHTQHQVSPAGWSTIADDLDRWDPDAVAVSSAASFVQSVSA